MSQLCELRNEVRELGSRVAEDALAHAIYCAARGKMARLEYWLQQAIDEVRRLADAGA
jgi:hypothetical protein